MKKTLIALATIAATGFGAAALAEGAMSGPVMMSDTQMDQIVAGNEKNIYVYLYTPPALWTPSCDIPNCGLLDVAPGNYGYKETGSSQEPYKKVGPTDVLPDQNTPPPAHTPVAGSFTVEIEIGI